MNIWQQLSKPIFALAPMEDVTDTVFRRVLLECAKPDLFFTEFTNVEGLCSKGRDRISHRLQFTPSETPLIAQIWGLNPDKFLTVAQELAEAGFDGIDLNMGCPERSVVRRGACSGLINNHSLAAEIIAATKQGAGSLPVSVKTRCGTNSWVTEDWIHFLLSQDLAALTIHGRIAKEMSHFPARWEEIAKAVAIRNHVAPDTTILGNGDVASYQDGLDKIAHSGVDGVMVGRGIFQNPWFFNPHSSMDKISDKQKLTTLQRHLELWHQTWVKPDGSTVRNFEAMKKFYKMYTREMAEATSIRADLMALHSAPDTIRALQQMIDKAD